MKLRERVVEQIIRELRADGPELGREHLRSALMVQVPGIFASNVEAELSGAMWEMEKMGIIIVEEEDGDIFYSFNYECSWFQFIPGEK